MTEKLKEIVIGTGYIRAFISTDSNFEATKKDERGNILGGLYKGIPLKVDVDRIAESVDEKELLSFDELRKLGIDLIAFDNPRVQILAYKRKNVLYMIVNDEAFNDYLGTFIQ